MKDIVSLSKDLNEPKWLLDERTEASGSISGFSFSFDDPKEPEIKKSRNIKVYSVQEMLSKDQKFVRHVFASRKRDYANNMEAYVNSFFKSCNFIFVDQGKTAELEFALDSSVAMTFLFLGSGSSLRMLGNVVSDSMSLMEITCEENSLLNAGMLKQKGAFSYCRKSAGIRTGAKANFVSFMSGTGFCKTESLLAGVGAKAFHTDLSVAGDAESTSLTSNVVHSANDTISEVVMKGVAQDSSDTLFNGAVSVEKNGHGSHSRLTQRVLLLDELAKAETHPVLEIKNNSVECSHSSSVTQLENEKLFYLMSRGMNEDIARTTMVAGFLRSAIERIEDEELRNAFKPDIAL